MVITRTHLDGKPGPIPAGVGGYEKFSRGRPVPITISKPPSMVIISRMRGAGGHQISEMRKGIEQWQWRSRVQG